MRFRRRGVTATLLFFAFTAPFGIAAHLVSELAGLGWHDDADVAFSARHGYLALIAAVAFAVLAGVLRRVPAGDRRRRIAEVVAALPFRGRGAAFIVLSFAVQFGFFAVTQIGEGCPLCGGDVVTGVFAAALAALLGALLVTFGQRRVLEFALALLWFARFRDAGPTASPQRDRDRRTAVRALRRSPFAFRYRPPPVAI